MARKQRRWITLVTIGSVSTLVGFLLFNKNAREKTVICVKEGKEFVTDAGVFIKENREDISDVIKGTTEKVNELMQVASEDVEQIAKHSSHLKATATDVLNTAKDAGRELQQHRRNAKMHEHVGNVTSLPKKEN